MTSTNMTFNVSVTHDYFTWAWKFILFALLRINIKCVYPVCSRECALHTHTRTHNEAFFFKFWFFLISLYSLWFVSISICLVAYHTITVYISSYFVLSNHIINWLFVCNHFISSLYNLFMSDYTHASIEAKI